MIVKQKYNQVSLVELQRRGYEVLFVQIANKRGFLIGNKRQIAQIKSRQFVVGLEETRKNSIMQQVMATQMGRPIGEKRTEINRYYASVLNVPKGGWYPAWEIFS